MYIGEENEVWKDVRTWVKGVKYDYTGYYEVSNLGRVRSLDREVKGKQRNQIKKGKIIKPILHNTGYYIIGLHKNGKQITTSVHRIVWESFNGQVPDGYEVNHIDENTQNPELSNLNLMTHIENMNWGTGRDRMKRKLTNRKDQSKPVLQFDLDGNYIAEYPSTKEVERVLNFYHSNIGRCCVGIYNQAYGYKWSYKE